MKLHIYQTKRFTKDINNLIKIGRILINDFEDLK